MKVFYSQQIEDLYVYNNFINKPNNTGIFVELGGLDGVTYSNTKFFEDCLNFRGTLIEPTNKFEIMKLNRPNNNCHNVGVYYSESEIEFLGDDAMAGIIETMNENHKSKMVSNNSSRKIKCVPFRDILQKDNIKYIDLLSIDVEGAEHAVLDSMDWNIPVYVIVIELDGSNPEKDEKCREIMRKNGYEFRKKIHINEFWINPNYFRKDDLYDTNIPKIKIENKRASEPIMLYFLEPHIREECFQAINE